MASGTVPQTPPLPSPKSAVADFGHFVGWPNPRYSEVRLGRVGGGWGGGGGGGGGGGFSRGSRWGGRSARITRWAGKKPSHDHVEPPRVLPLLLWGAHNPLIRRYFFRVFRFAKMGVADAGT